MTFPINCEAHDLPTDANGECFLCRGRPPAQREPFRGEHDGSWPEWSQVPHRDVWSVPFYGYGRWRRVAEPLGPSPFFLHVPSLRHRWRLSPLAP